MQTLENVPMPASANTNVEPVAAASPPSVPLLWFYLLCRIYSLLLVTDPFLSLPEMGHLRVSIHTTPILANRTPAGSTE